MSLDEMSLDKMSLDEISLDKMSIDHLSVYQGSYSKHFFRKIMNRLKKLKCLFLSNRSNLV